MVLWATVSFPGVSFSQCRWYGVQVGRFAGFCSLRFAWCFDFEVSGLRVRLFGVDLCALRFVCFVRTSALRMRWILFGDSGC